MGATSSMLPLPEMDAERKQSIVASMRTEYDAAVAQGASPDEVQRLMTVRFQALVSQGSSAAAGPGSPGPPGSPLPGSPQATGGKTSRMAALSSQAQKLAPTGLKKAPISKGSDNVSMRNGNAAAGGGGGTSGRSKPGLTRRRSYGEREANKIQSAAKLADLATSQSDALLAPIRIDDSADDVAAAAATTTTAAAAAAVDETRDSWDSVSQLPFCTVCQMAFKSLSVLDRHIKYSDMHLKAVKKLEDEANNTASSEGDGGAKLPEPAKPVPRQVEGQDYKLLYTGTKFFWRSQDNVDLSFFHHLACSVIEIVPFDVYKGKELERLYFDLYKIHNTIDPEVETKLEQLRVDFKEKNKTDKFQSQVFPEDQERAQLTRVAITTFLLTRLHFQQVVPDKPQAQITFIHSSLPSANPEQSPLITNPPSLLVPVTVVHRRNTSTEEVKQKLNELEIDQKALRASINKAETIAAMVHRFASIYAARKKLLAMSLPRRRWVLAIRKVIQINLVTKVRALLATREAARAAAAAEAGGAAGAGAAGSPAAQRKGRQRGASQYIKESHV